MSDPWIYRHVCSGPGAECIYINTHWANAAALPVCQHGIYWAYCGPCLAAGLPAVREKPPA